MRKLIIIGTLLAALMLIAACAPKEADTLPSPQPMPPQVVDDTMPPAQDTTQDVAQIDQQVTDIDDVTSDLDLNDLENLDKELEELENLEI